LGVILFWRRIDETNPQNAAALADPNFDWSARTWNTSGERARNFCAQGWYEQTPRDAECMASASSLASNGCALRREGWTPLDPDNFQLIPPVQSPYTCNNSF
jgi:hypothetical protein